MLNPTQSRRAATANLPAGKGAEKAVLRQQEIEHSSTVDAADRHLRAEFVTS
jgi:hypothetical protein